MDFFTDIDRSQYFNMFSYTDWQKKIYNKNQNCFIQAVMLSYYVEINQQQLLKYHV